jgi:hypothetical protein
MSIVKVNNIQDTSSNNLISNTNATTVTIGVSTDTIVIAANATLTATSISSSTISSTTLYVGGQQVTATQFPTITSISPSTIDNNATNIVITGTNFVSVPIVEAINSSTGAIIRANSVAYTSAVSLTTNFTLPIDGTYYVRVENNTGLATRSSNPILTVSDAPVWTTAAGSLGSFSQGVSISTNVVATSDSAITYSKLSGSFPGGLSLNTTTGVISGTESGATTTTTYNFTLTATDAESQTANRAFSMTIQANYFGDGSDGALST